MSGLSTMGSISFGLALVAGRKRVPRPATGKTATSTRFFFDLAGIRAPTHFRGPEPYHAPGGTLQWPGRDGARVCATSRRHDHGGRQTWLTRRVWPVWQPWRPERRV